MEFDQLEGLYHEMQEAVVTQNQAIEHLQAAVVGMQETPKVPQEPPMGPGPTVGGPTVGGPMVGGQTVGKPDSSGCHCIHTRHRAMHRNGYNAVPRDLHRAAIQHAASDGNGRQ